MFTIVRKYIESAAPDTILGKEEECFVFDTERQAYKCLELCFDNGKIYNDEKYGKVRCYITEYIPHYTPIIY